MIPSQLKSRTKYIKASPSPQRACIKAFSRKETGNIEIEEDGQFSDSFDTFFDYEKELSSMRPSGEQYIENQADDENSSSFVTMENKNYSPSDTSPTSPMIMEDLGQESGAKKSFEFKQCLHILDSDRRCKRQAPKSNDYCASHSGIH